jgi:hypothetical protein
MDPNACLERLRDAVSNNDSEEAAELRATLRTWVGMGGFEPSDENWRDA